MEGKTGSTIVRIGGLSAPCRRGPLPIPLANDHLDAADDRRDISKKAVGAHVIGDRTVAERRTAGLHPGGNRVPPPIPEFRLGSTESGRHRAGYPFVDGPDRILDPINFLWFEVSLAALLANPSRNSIGLKVVVPSIDLNRCLIATHSSSTVNAGHVDYLVLKSASHSSGLGRYGVIMAR